MLCLRSLLLLALLTLPSFPNRTMAADGRPNRAALWRSHLVVTASQHSTRRSRPSNAVLAGGGTKTAALIGVIQETVAPNSWDPANIGPPPPTNPSPAALQLVEIIQTNVQPLTWDVNGGSGTILIIPW